MLGRLGIGDDDAALVRSGCCTPTPAQNCLMPPPVPVDSTTGVLKAPPRPKVSATALLKGNTVEEPTMRIWSRPCALAVPDMAAAEAMAARAATASFLVITVDTSDSFA
jgi:hypothetical protein